MNHKPIITEADAKVIALLPDSLATVARLIGVASTLRFVEKWGGRRPYIPAEATPEHPLAELLGIDALMALSAEYPAERLELPRAQRWLLALRDAAIAQARAEGASQAQVAQEYQLCERTVRNIDRRTEMQDDRQIGLF